MSVPQHPSLAEALSYQGADLRRAGKRSGGEPPSCCGILSVTQLVKGTLLFLTRLGGRVLWAAVFGRGDGGPEILGVGSQIGRQELWTVEAQALTLGTNRQDQSRNTMANSGAGQGGP